MGVYFILSNNMQWKINVWKTEHNSCKQHKSLRGKAVSPRMNQISNWKMMSFFFPSVKNEVMKYLATKWMDLGYNKTKLEYVHQKILRYRGSNLATGF